MYRAPLYLLLAVTASLASACDQCAGTTPCGSTAPRLVLEGQIVRAEDGRGVDNIPIDVVRRSGPTLGADSLTAVTAAGGFWRVETSASSAATINVDVHVRTPALAHPYVVSVKATPVTRAGDAQILERWVVDPYFPYAEELFHRVANTPVPSVAVDFRRTSGPHLTGPSVTNDVAHTGTDGFGTAQLFLYQVFALDTGSVTGDLIVHLPAPLDTSVARGFVLTPTYIYRDTPIVGRLGTGPTFAYVVQTYDRATGAVLPHIQIDFHRVGGVPLDVPDFTITSDANGFAFFPPIQPGNNGNVIADITLHPPRGNLEVRHDTIPTLDSDQAVLLGNWLTGPALPYFGLVKANGQIQGNVTVRVRQTAGVLVSPADTTEQTLSFGALILAPVPAGIGSATFELTFTPPAPFHKFVVSNLVLQVLQRDVPGGSLVWTWNLEAPDGPPGTTVTILP